MEKQLKDKGGRSAKTTFWKVLALCSKGYHYTDICSALNISPQRYYYLRKELILSGHLDATGHPTGKKGLNDVYTGSDTCPTISTGNFVRLHRVQIRLPILRWWKHPENVKMVTWGKVKYWQTSVKDVKVRVFDKCLDVYLPHFWGSGVEDCDKKMLSWFLQWIPICEEIIGCKVRVENGVADWKITKREYAFVGAENAKVHVKKGEVIHVKDSNGELRYIVDQSLGTPEFESVHPVKSRPDAVKFENFYRDVGAGRWDLLQKGVAEGSDVVANNTKLNLYIIRVLKAKGILNE